MLLKRDTPCHGCNERHSSCHGDCQRYKEFKDNLSAEKNTIWENKAKDHIQYAGYHKAKIIKIRNKQNRG